MNVSGNPDNPTWFAPEKLRVLPFQIFPEKVPERLGPSFLKVATRSPAANRALIQAEGLKSFGININEIDNTLVSDLQQHE